MDRLMKLCIMALWNRFTLTSPAMSSIRNPALVVHRKPSLLILRDSSFISGVHFCFSWFTQFNKPRV